MKAYRIQDADGRGPFKPGKSQEWVEWRDDHENLKPYFEELGSGEMKSTGVPSSEMIRSGCKSIRQLRRWFTHGEYKKLLEMGYEAYEVECRIVAESYTQVLFEYDEPYFDRCRKIDLYKRT